MDGKKGVAAVGETKRWVRLLRHFSCIVAWNNGPYQRYSIRAIRCPLQHLPEDLGLSLRVKTKSVTKHRKYPSVTTVLQHIAYCLRRYARVNFESAASIYLRLAGY